MAIPLLSHSLSTVTLYWERGNMYNLAVNLFKRNILSFIVDRDSFYCATMIISITMHHDSNFRFIVCFLSLTSGHYWNTLK